LIQLLGAARLSFILKLHLDGQGGTCCQFFWLWLVILSVSIDSVLWFPNVCSWSYSLTEGMEVFVLHPSVLGLVGKISTTEI
jgi:hypothetical protein